MNRCLVAQGNWMLCLFLIAVAAFAGALLAPIFWLGILWLGFSGPARWYTE